MSLIVHVEIEINIFCPENFFFIFVGKGLFTRRSDSGKSRSEIGRVNKP